MTQIEAGERVGIDQATLGRIERGIIPYNQDFIERAALAYGCDPEDLLSIDPLKPDPPKLVYEALKHVSRAKQEEVVAPSRACTRTRASDAVSHGGGTGRKKNMRSTHFHA